MLSDYLGRWTDGRLGRGRFALLYALLVGASVVLLFVILGSAAAAGQLASDPEGLVKAIGRPVVVAWMGWLLLVAVMVLNLVAKRARDAGLPGWAGVAAMLVASGIGTIAGPPSSGLPLLVAIVMALVPTGQFGPPRGR